MGQLGSGGHSFRQERIMRGWVRAGEEIIGGRGSVLTYHDICDNMIL